VDNPPAGRQCLPQPIRFGGGSERFWSLDAIEKWDRDQEAAGFYLAVNDEVQS